ncbi:MAG: endonuclease NucS domain-containing protein, partial [Leptospirillum sp.]
MSIELGLWRIDDKLQPIHFEPMESELRLEDILAKNIGILVPKLMVIGRQVRTSFDKVIDILTIDITGNLSVIELKKEKTPRDIVAQVLDYGSWVSTLHDEDIAGIYNDYLRRYFPEEQTQSINETFCRYFNVTTMPDELNQSHQLIIVASFLDSSTERIVNYLAKQYKVDIKTIFFRFFKDGESEYLARVWSGEPIISSNSTDSEP